MAHGLSPSFCAPQTSLMAEEPESAAEESGLARMGTQIVPALPQEYAGAALPSEHSPIRHR
jgi:hypothetical protein